MWEWWQKNRPLLFSVVLLLAALLWYSVNLRQQDETNFLEGLVLRLTAPVQAGLDRVVQGAADVWGHYLYLVDTEEENRTLLEDNRNLSARLAENNEVRLENERLRRLLREHAPELPVQLVEGRSHEVLAACDVTLIASGTATLEAALFKRPMVIGYRAHWLNAVLFRRMSYLPYVGLPNILCREFVVPELLQEACQPAALADALWAQLDDTVRGERLASRFTEMHLQLRRDTARCATDAIAKILEA